MRYISIKHFATVLWGGGAARKTWGRGGGRFRASGGAVVETRGRRGETSWRDVVVRGRVDLFPCRMHQKHGHGMQHSNHELEQ